MLLWPSHHPRLFRVTGSALAWPWWLRPKHDRGQRTSVKVHWGQWGQCEFDEFENLLPQGGHESMRPFEARQAGLATWDERTKRMMLTLTMLLRIVTGWLELTSGALSTQQPCLRGREAGKLSEFVKMTWFRLWPPPAPLSQEWRLSSMTRSTPDYKAENCLLAILNNGQLLHEPNNVHVFSMKVIEK